MNALESARMKTPSAPCVSAVFAVAMATSIANAQRGPAPAPNYDAFYEPGPDSLVRRGVPKGKVAGPFKLMVFNDGATYTGSPRMCGSRMRWSQKATTSITPGAPPPGPNPAGAR